MIYHSRKIIAESGTFDGYLKVENGVITDLVRSDVEQLPADVDFGDATIIPGIIDTHNHGYMGWNPDKMENGEKEVEGYVKAVASVGVTSIFPTVTDEKGAFVNVVKVAEKDPDGARIMGIHSEGPYLNRVGEKGVDQGHPDPDPAFIEKMLKDARGLLKLVAIAPELPGAKEVIRQLNRNNVRVAYAHSNMTYEEAREAFKWGISVITHTANVMSGLHHRNMGGLGAAILDDEVYNELICDGLHVRNEMMDIIMRVKHNAFDKIMMISDNTHFGGFPAGRYSGGFAGDCFISDEGFCLTDTGRLAGSAKPVIFGMRNLVKNMGLPLETVCRMSALNPATVYGFGDRKGSLRVGKDADFAVIDDDFNCLYTYREGRKVYDCSVDTDLLNHECLDKCKVG
ncbi:MAG: amidohydrolase family protein [Erysipelotrichaceae bacterium]|nr:amidohydrolase family protein [Erysipelotrichaceae bacterium]